MRLDILGTTISFHEMLTVHCTFNWTRSKSSSSGKFFALILLKKYFFQYSFGLHDQKTIEKVSLLDNSKIIIGFQRVL